MTNPAVPTGPSSGRRPPALTARRRVTRERLFEAAGKVFAERGIGAATVEEICERAGYTRGAFYSNFVDKDALVEALLLREVERVSADLHEIGDIGTDEPLDIPALLDRFFALHPLDWEPFAVRAELTLAALRAPQSRHAYHAMRMRQVSAVGAAVADLLDRAGLESTLPLDDLIEVLYGILQRSAMLAVVDGDPDIQALARRLMGPVLTALTRSRTR